MGKYYGEKKNRERKIMAPVCMETKQHVQEFLCCRAYTLSQVSLLMKLSQPHTSPTEFGPIFGAKKQERYWPRDYSLPTPEACYFNSYIHVKF